jgi:hypothetical protein
MGGNHDDGLCVGGGNGGQTNFLGKIPPFTLRPLSPLTVAYFLALPYSEHVESYN